MDAAGNPAPFDWSTNEKFQDALGLLALADPAAASEILTGLLNGALNFYGMDRNTQATGITANGGNAVMLDLTRPLEELVVTLIHEWTHVRSAAGATAGPNGTVVATTPLPLTGENLPCAEAHAYAAALDLIVKLQQNYGTNPLFKCSFIKSRQEKCETKNGECNWAAPPPGPPQPTCKDLVSELAGTCL